MHAILFSFFLGSLVFAFSIQPAKAAGTPGIEWKQVYIRNGYGANSVLRTSEGGYMMAGATGTDGFLLKVDASGNVEWSKSYGGSGTDGFSYMVRTSDGGYILVGSTTSFGAGGSDVYLVKVTAQGDEVWSQTYGGIRDESAASVELTSDGGYIIGGTATGNIVIPYYAPGIDTDAYVVKVDSFGEVQWIKSYNGPGNFLDSANSVIQTSEGGYIIAGLTAFQGFNVDRNVWLIKTDSNGNSLWDKNFGSPSADWAQSVFQTPDQGYVVGGYAGGEATGWGDFLIMKTDTAGDVEWRYNYGGGGSEYLRSMKKASDGGYIMAGNSYSSDSVHGNAYLVKVNSNGVYEWSTWCGQDAENNPAYDSFAGVEQTSESSYIAAGLTAYYPYYGDIYLVKFNTIWASDINGVSKHFFLSDETMYATVPTDGQIVTFYVAIHQTWNQGNYLINRDVSSDAPNTIELNPSGTQTVQIWPQPMTTGVYDIVMDTNNNGIFDQGTDQITQVYVTSSFVVPEYLLGSLLALAACFAAFVVVKKSPKSFTKRANN